MQFQHGPAVCGICSMDGMDETQVVNATSQMRKQFADPRTAFAMLPKPPGRFQKIPCWSKLDSRLGKRQRLSVVPVEQWFGIECIKV